jgi:hypothetical protein
MVSPVPGVALNETVPVTQTDPAVPVGAAGEAFTVANTAVLDEDTQPVVVSLASA